VPLVVHYWADLQSVHGFHCYYNAAPNAKCQRVLVLALCLAVIAISTHIFMSVHILQQKAQLSQKKTTQCDMSVESTDVRLY